MREEGTETMANEQSKPLVLKCRLTVPADDKKLFDIYVAFTNGNFTVLNKSDLYPTRDHPDLSNFYLDLLMWDIEE